MMVRRGTAPFLECSSRGFKPFSAFYARITKHGCRSIEDLYQASKIFEDGSTGLSWKAAKGRRAINMQDCKAFYETLWREYLAEKPHLVDVLKSASGLSDMFGKEGNTCQADVLWKLRHELLAKG